MQASHTRRTRFLKLFRLFCPGFFLGSEGCKIPECWLSELYVRSTVAVYRAFYKEDARLLDKESIF